MAAEDLPDDRLVKEVLPPPRHPFPRDKLFTPEDDLPDLDALREHLQREGRLRVEDALELIHRTTAAFKKEPNLLRLHDPITVVGDIHGQYFDLLRLFEVGGNPETTQYLFLGDYVDRGCFATEVVFLLFAMKLTWPKRFFMLRGNHECRQLTAFFNFKDECKYKYNIEVYDAMMEAFDALPLSAIVNDKFLCMHGGLSPDIKTLKDIESIDRNMEVPRQGPMCDILWADPVEKGDKGSLEGGGDSGSDSEDDANQPLTTYYAYNQTRQCSFVFGVDAVEQFLIDNNLTSLIRAHEAQLEGYKMQMINAKSGIPRVITIFSAPNYCDVYKNKAACLEFDNNLLNIRQFVCSPHPYFLPNFMDVFEWSLPFVAEKVTDMLANVLDFNAQADEDSEEKETIIEARGVTLKNKVLAVSKMLRMYKMLRQEQDNIVQLKQLTPSHKIPFGLLREGPKAIKKVLTGFEQALRADKVNERRPGDEEQKKDEKDAAPPSPAAKPKKP